MTPTRPAKEALLIANPSFTDHLRQRETSFITLHPDGEFPEKTEHWIAHSLQHKVESLGERRKPKNSLHDPVHATRPFTLRMRAVQAGHSIQDPRTQHPHPRNDSGWERATARISSEFPFSNFPFFHVATSEWHQMEIGVSEW